MPGHPGPSRAGLNHILSTMVGSMSVEDFRPLPIVPVQPGLGRDGLPEDTLVLDPEDLDVALVGTCWGRAVYDREKLILAFITLLGGDREDAEEWVSYNVERAIPYEGDAGPIIAMKLDAFTQDAPEDDEEEEHRQLFDLEGAVYVALVPDRIKVSGREIAEA